MRCQAYVRIGLKAYCDLASLRVCDVMHSWTGRLRVACGAPCVFEQLRGTYLKMYVTIISHYFASKRLHAAIVIISAAKFSRIGCLRELSDSCTISRCFHLLPYF